MPLSNPEIGLRPEKFALKGFRPPRTPPRLVICHRSDRMSATDQGRRTFYSWKGGVGRTMALANIAVQLARKGNRVLMVNWDLRAPG